MTFTAQQANAQKLAVEAIREAVDAAGDAGIPSGHLYAMLMAYGLSLPAYQSLIAILVKTGKIAESGHLLRKAG